ncbi:MAG: RNase P modulator RnpM [Lachnospiraceae bacterium]
MNTVRKQPLRQCIGCGEQKEKKHLIRILKTPEGSIILDATGKQNGRGAYICPNPECMKKVAKTHGLDRAFKMAVPEDVYVKLQEELKKYEE